YEVGRVGANGGMSPHVASLISADREIGDLQVFERRGDAEVRLYAYDGSHNLKSFLQDESVVSGALQALIAQRANINISEKTFSLFPVGEGIPLVGFLLNTPVGTTSDGKARSLLLSGLLAPKAQFEA